MGRIHLFEFEDQPWFPAFLRNYGTDFLQFGANQFDLYRNIVPVLERGLNESNTIRIIDLASGGGGGFIKLSKHLQEKHPDLQITLTDYYPNVDAFRYSQRQSDAFDYVEEPVDARAVPDHLKGLRTQFLSLHHFRPRDAGQILQNAVDSRQPIAIFEAQERNVPSLAAMVLSPLTVLLTTPFIRPFRWGRLLFTYLIPLVPLFVWWDGIVSALRTYSVKEMQGLVSQLENKDQFEWEIGKVRSGPGKVLYLLGYPNT